MAQSHTQSVLVLVHSITKRPLEATLLKQLMDLGILFELIEVSAKHPSPLPSADEVACILSEPNESCQKFSFSHFPNVPVILIPATASDHPSSLNNLETAANSTSGSPTLAIGKAGETNAALFAASILALKNTSLKKRLRSFRDKQTRTVLQTSLPTT